MITNETSIAYSEQYLISQGISPKDSIFFDIETTGFKAGYSHLYLIGVSFRSNNGRWILHQWMAERPQEETQLLKVFSEFLKSFTTVIHFNGKRFDIPYLEEKYEQYQLPSPFTGLTSVDLYQDFRPLKSFLKLEYMNQKSLELFLGLERDDKYDGGKLIPVYRDFCKTGCDEKLRLLLLHNQEDVSGMLTLTSIYGYLDLFSLSKFSNLSVELLENQDTSKNIIFTFELTAPVPVPVSHHTDISYLTLNKSTGKLMIPVLEDTLYYFFSDYKNYYYLPEEDQALHKSVAIYVDKKFRQQAKKENCYTKHSGFFLPQPPRCDAQAYRRSYSDPFTWVLWEEKNNTAAYWEEYLSLFLQNMRK